MAQMWTRVALFAALGTAAVALALGHPASAGQKAEKKSIKEIMQAGHKGADAQKARVTEAVKAAKWDDAQKAAKELADNGALLPKATPKRGDAASWEEKSKKYAENTKALYEATVKKDAAATKASLDTLNGSCMACHNNHKGKGK